MSDMFWIAVMSSFSSWDDIIVHVKLLVYYVLFAKDDNTGFLSVGVDIFDRLYLKEWPISLPMVSMSSIKQIYPPLWKNSKNRKMSNNMFWLMLKIFSLIDPFLLREYYLFSQNNESSLEQ